MYCIADRDSTTHGNSILSQGEEDFFSTWAELMGKSGYHLTKSLFRAQINTYLIACDISSDDAYFSLSDDTIERLLKRYNLATTTKANYIDVARAKQHTPEIRDVMFKIFDNSVQRIHKIYPQYCPWENLSKVPARCKANMDEF